MSDGPGGWISRGRSGWTGELRVSRLPGSAVLGTAGGAGDLWLTLFSSSSQSGARLWRKVAKPAKSVHTNAASPFIRKPGRSCLKACKSIPPPAWLPTPQHFTLEPFRSALGLRRQDELSRLWNFAHAILFAWNAFPSLPTPLLSAWECSISLPQICLHFSKSLPRHPHPQFYSRNYFAFVPWAGFHMVFTLYGNLSVTYLPPLLDCELLVSSWPPGAAQ